MDFHKRSCFKRAKELLIQESEESLRYACLELRYCIESIAYEYLKLNEKRVPEDVLGTWQPKKVMEILLQYDPDIDQDYTLKLCSENCNW